MRKEKNNNYHKPTVLPSFSFCFFFHRLTLVLPYFCLPTTAVIVVLHTPPFEALSIYLFISCYRDTSLLLF